MTIKMPVSLKRQDRHFGCRLFLGAIVTMVHDINKAKAILKILKEEYGITTEKELDEAIKKQGFIDVTPFVAPPPSTSQPPSHSEQ